MAHVLIVTAGRTGLRNQCVELIRRLERSGHRCTFAAPSTVATALELDGVTFLPIVEPPVKPPTRDIVTQGALGKVRRWFSRLTRAAEYRSRAADRLVHPEYERAVRELRPDLILVDVELPAYAVASYALAPRLALLDPFFAARRHTGVPPLHTSIQQGQGFRGSRLGIELAWLRYLVWKAWKHGVDWLRAPGSHRIAAHRALAKRFDFPDRREFSLFDWLFPFTFKAIPTLNLNAVELDFPHALHWTERHTGPLIRFDREDRSELLDAVAQRALKVVLQRDTSERKLVFCAFGTAFAGDDSDFVRRLVDAVAAHPEWDVVIALGGRLKSDKLGTLPSHVHAFDWVPQLELLARSDCAVVHSGNSTLYECVHFEVPTVLYPFDVNDQMGNAARAAFHGLGVIGDRDSDSEARIATHISRVLGDDSLREAVKTMKARLHRYEDQNAAVRVVESLLSDTAARD